MDRAVAPMEAGFEFGQSSLLSWFRPRVERSLVRVLREDRLLRWAFALLWIASVIPMCFTPFLPFGDMGINVAMASLLVDVATGHGVAEKYFSVNWAPNPYWTTYALLALVEQVTGPLIAAKVVTAVTLLLIPLGMMRLLLTLGRNPRLAVWAFLLGYDHNVYWGWLSLMIGFGYSFFIIAWTLEARTVREALRVSLHSALLGLTHIQGVWLVMVAVPLLVPVGRPVHRRILVHGIALAGLSATIVPWLASRTGSAASIPAAFSFIWHSLDHKLIHFFANTLDNFVRPEGKRVSAVAFVVLVLGPLFLTLLPRESPRAGAVAPLVLLLAAGGLYMLLPMQITGPIVHWGTYPRYATAVLLFLLLFPAPRLDGRWALALLPGVLVNLLLDVQIARQFHNFGERTRPLLQVIEHVKPHASVLPLVLDVQDPDPDAQLQQVGHQLCAYVTAIRKGYDGYLWDIPKWPLQYRPGRMKPKPSWDVKKQLAFNMSYGKHYDYVLLQGFRRGDPLRRLTKARLPRPKLVIEAGRWRLYEILR